MLSGIESLPACQAFGAVGTNVPVIEQEVKLNK